MKKFLFILVAGILWCNFSVAEIISLKKCWPTDARYDFDAKGFKYKNFEDMAKRRGIEEYMFTLDTVAYTITRTYVHTDEYIKKVDWNPDKYNKEIYQITNLGGDVITAELNIPVKAFKLEDKLDVNLLTGKVYSTMVNVRDNKVRTSRIEWSCNKSNEGKDGSQGSASGTAFFISNKGYILTNNHVVDGCKVLKIIYNNQEYDTSLISTDKTLDLALLKANVRPKSYITFSRGEPKKRQQIIVAGYPLGKGLSDDLKINDGRISSLKGFENNSNEITVDVAINPGNSGGPIVNQKGQLVAIAVAGMSKDVTEGINFGIKASAAKNFLKSNKISPSAGYLNFSMSDDKIVELLEESTVYTFCN